MLSTVIFVLLKLTRLLPYNVAMSSSRDSFRLLVQSLYEQRLAKTMPAIEYVDTYEHKQLLVDLKKLKELGVINTALKEPGSGYLRGSYVVSTNSTFDDYYKTLDYNSGRLYYDKESAVLSVAGEEVRIKGSSQKRLLELFTKSDGTLKEELLLDDLVLEWDEGREASIKRRKPYDAALNLNSFLIRSTSGSIKQLFRLNGMESIAVDIQ